MAAQPETTVGRSDHILGADDPREPLDPLRYELGVLDPRRRVGDDAGRQNLAFRQLGVFPQRLLVLVPRAFAASKR